MTNPNNALGTNAALGGRTSVDAFNDAISSLTRGVVSGFAVTPSSAMTLNVGGTAGVRDVAVAVSPNGNRVSVDNRTTSPIKVTMAAASASSARIDAIVAYVNSPSQVTETTPDNPTACGIIPVSGTTSAQPTDSAIRTAISADGGTGSTAYYAIIAIVKLAANTTTITSNMITIQKSRIADRLVTNASIANKAVTSDKVDWTTLVDSSSRYVKLGGVVIQWGVADFGNQSFSTDFWGIFNRAARQDMHFNYPIAFDEKPVLIMNVVDTNKPLLGICYAQNDGSGSRSPSFTVYCPKDFTATANVKIQWVAIGAKA